MQEITGVIRRTVHAKSHAGIAKDGSMRGACHPPNQEEELTNYRGFGLESGGVYAVLRRRNVELLYGNCMNCMIVNARISRIGFISLLIVYWSEPLTI